MNSILRLRGFVTSYRRLPRHQRCSNCRMKPNYAQSLARPCSNSGPPAHPERHRAPIFCKSEARGTLVRNARQRSRGMANDPFTIRIFVPDGDPEGVRIIDRMNWTGLGIVFPREKWPTTKQRTEFSRAGVYILVGYRGEGDELPTVYIGEGDVIRNRID